MITNNKVIKSILSMLNYLFLFVINWMFGLAYMLGLFVFILIVLVIVLILFQLTTKEGETTVYLLKNSLDYLTTINFLFFFGAVLIYIHGIMIARLIARSFPLSINNNLLSIDIKVYRLFVLLLVFYLIFTFGNYLSIPTKFMSIFYYENFTKSLNFYLFIFPVVYFFIKNSLIKSIDHIDYILYLRKFSGFSDRSLIITIIKSLNNTLPLLFIVPLKNKFRDWDPYIILFHPFKLISFYKNTPIHISTSTELWKEDIEKLIDSSKCIIIDVSEITISIKFEIDLIVDKNMTKSTIFISDKDDIDSYILNKLSSKKHDINHIKYKKVNRFSASIFFFFIPLFFMLLIDLLVFYGYFYTEYRIENIDILMSINIVFIMSFILLTIKKTLDNKFMISLKNKVSTIVTKKE